MQLYVMHKVALNVQYQMRELQFDTFFFTAAEALARRSLKKLGENKRRLVLIRRLPKEITNSRDKVTWRGGLLPFPCTDSLTVLSESELLDTYKTCHHVVTPLDLDDSGLPIHGVPCCCISNKGPTHSSKPIHSHPFS